MAYRRIKTEDYFIKTQAKQWRNEELKATDHITMISDYPNKDEYIVYRQDLRDWPLSQNFPSSYPTGSDLITGSLPIVNHFQ